ncbi:protein amalgam [Teleopsis dalmanni]|uniref:protein amalgam n=1 Tax=Teleopsis dalmanni TaxID=139649 RepID=UPI0018CD5585|nr:protein amalgam [Teleopsis dalmanni]
MISRNIQYFLTFYLLLGILHKGFCGKIQDDPNSTNDYLSDDYVYDDEDDISKPNSNEQVSINPLLPTMDPPYFVHDEMNSHANPGEDVLLNCDVRNFQINNVILWYKENISISNGQFVTRNRIESYKNNTIRIKNVQIEDAGNYYCQLLPQNKSLHITLSVGGRLSILCDGRDVTERSVILREGDTHVFECKIYTSQSTNVKWSFNGQRAENVVTEINGTKLTIDGISAEHAGIYQCLGDDGTSEPPNGMVTVDVQYSPKLSTHRRYVNTQKNSKAELYCDFKANPISISKWLRNEKVLGYSEKYMVKNVVLNGHNRTILTIADTTSDDLGEYFCHVENSVGFDKLKIRLIFEPELPQFEDIKIDGRKVRMQWLVRSVQPLSEAVLSYQIEGSYTWSTVSVIHTQRHGENTDMWKITHEMELIPGNWHARMKAKNTVGWSEFSAAHNFKIKHDNEEIKDVESLPPDEIVKSAGIGLGNKNNSGVSVKINKNIIAAVLLVLIVIWEKC